MYNCDQPLLAFEEHLKFIKRESIVQKPDFILLGGDDSPHDNDIQTQETNFEATRIVYSSFEKLFSPLKVYSAIGNHEVYPVDLMDEIPRSSPFLNRIATLWSSSLTQENIRTVRKAGYYSVTLMRGLKLIVLNTQWMDIINFWLYKNDTKDFGDQFKWFESELLGAENNKEKVYILSHFPSGFPGYGYGFPNFMPKKLITYNNLIKRFNNTIISSFHGHKHMDYFQLFLNGNNSYSLSLQGSALSPWTNRNPGVRLYKYNKETFELLDYTEYYTNLTENNIKGKI